MTQHPFVAIRVLLAEAVQLGVRFQIRGRDVALHNAEALPATLREALEQHQRSGLLWTYLGGEGDEDGPRALLEALEVTPRLVETVAEARAAVRELIRDLRRYDGYLAVDTETYPDPEFEVPVFERLTKGGGPGSTTTIRPSIRIVPARTCCRRMQAGTLCSCFAGRHWS